MASYLIEIARPGGSLEELTLFPRLATPNRRPSGLALADDLQGKWPQVRGHRLNDMSALEFFTAAKRVLEESPIAVVLPA